LYAWSVWHHRPVIARTVRLAQSTSSTTSIVLLVAFNLLPLAGVVLWGWNVGTLLILYWVENGIVGILNIPKILLARGTGPAGAATQEPEVEVAGQARPLLNGIAANITIALFFVVHYGIFWLVHGVFVLTLSSWFGRSGPPLVGPDSFEVLPDGTVILGAVESTGPDLSAVAWAALGLAISHTVSFAINYVGRREYLKVSPTQQMGAPYGRLVILHMSIILGAIVSIAIGSPIGAVIVLVLLKTGVDLALHLREHDRLAVKPQPA
jgi:hypothetical protein